MNSFLQRPYHNLVGILVIFCCGISMCGCDGFVGFIALLIVVAGILHLALKAIARSRSEKTNANPQYDSNFDQTFDINDHIQLQVATTWNMQAHAEAGRWTISDKSINFKGSVIPNPMFYMGNISKNAYPDPALIDPSLPVSKEVKGHIQDLGYWPGYSDMTAGQRRVFINWLATGRKDLNVSIGYVFVYYYGLERRLLVDQQNTNEILMEIRRLRSLYNNNSFQSYSSQLLAFESVKNINNLTEELLFEAFPSSYGGRGYNEVTLNAVLGWHIVHQKPLSWKWALAVAQNDPRSPSSIVTKRVKDEFERLFQQRYREKCGDGIMLRSAKRNQLFSYAPASASLSSMRQSSDRTEKLFQTPIHNPLGIISQFKPLVEIWTQCIENLKAFSRQQANVTYNQPLTADAWEKLPYELQSQVDHPESEYWSKVIEKNIEEGTVAWVRVNELAALKEIPVCDKLTVGQSIKLVETGVCLGYAIEPDARLIRKGYAWSEKLAIYHDPKPNEHLDAESSYSAASVMLHLAISIAAADDNIDPKELQTITEFLDNQFNLSDSERERLTAYGNYLIQSKISLAGVAKRIQTHLTYDERHKVGRLLVAVAAADGVFEKSEITALKKAYRAMKLDPNDVVNEVENVKAISTEQGEPIVVQKSKPGQTGEQLPPKPLDAKSTDPVQLNPKAIAKIINDTKDVAKMLGSVLAQSNEDDSNDSYLPQQLVPTTKPERTKQTQLQPAQALETINSTIALSPEYRPFLQELINEARWTELEIRSLADKHKVMVNGAIDAINEWSEDELGDFLIDGDNPYTIQRELLKG